ncbi:MAG: hydrogenase small subunit [Anaerolineales bacterium]|nr:MAG: hydrogenase small subunit [Anaerolineales bacterium]
MTDSSVQQVLTERGLTRRDFLKFCSSMAGALALPRRYSTRIAQALEAPKRTPVIWMEFQDCAGCTEALLRASRPTVAEIVLDILSVDYHETIMAASGHRAEEAKKQTIDAGGYILVVEGSIPRAEDGVHCCIGGRTALDLLSEAASNALAVIAVGHCAAFGGVPRAAPNPTDAVGVMDLVKDKPVLNLPGCPYNTVNLTATVVHFLTFGELPAMDELLRPLFAFGARIHDNCERRGHFDAGHFVMEWGDEGHRLGWCLYKMGCKGPVSFHNCPAVRYNDGASWPIGSGHGCIGCSEPDFWEWGAYNVTELQKFTPPDTFAPVQLPVQQIAPASAALMGGLAGLAVGAAGAAAYASLSKKEKPEAAEDAPAEEE